MIVLVLLALLALQTTPALLSYGTFKVSFVLPFAVAMACVSDELSAGILGAVTGVLWDIVSGRLVGFGGLILLLLCVGVSLLFGSYLRANRYFCGLFCAGVFLIYVGIDYVFYYMILSFSGAVRYLLIHGGLGGIVAGILGVLFFTPCQKLDQWGSREPKI